MNMIVKVEFRINKYTQVFERVSTGEGVGAGVVHYSA
jgi:hypothetical protein